MEPEEKYKWQISVPIFKNKLILKQLGLAIGLPFGILILLLLFLLGIDIYLLYTLFLLTLLFLLTWILIMTLYKGKYKAEFVLDSEGILCRTQKDQAKKNKIINLLTIILGIGVRSYAASSAGIFAIHKQQIYIRWIDIKTVKYRPKEKTILLKKSCLDSIAVFCPEEKYELIISYVKSHTLHI